MQFSIKDLLVLTVATAVVIPIARLVDWELLQPVLWLLVLLLLVFGIPTGALLLALAGVHVAIHSFTSRTSTTVKILLLSFSVTLNGLAIGVLYGWAVHFMAPAIVSVN